MNPYDSSFWGSHCFQNLLSLVAVAIAAVTLRYLVKYVRATELLAKQSVAQVEAISKPAVVALFSDCNKDIIVLRNVGAGTAVNVRWELIGAELEGAFPYLQKDEPTPQILGRLQLGNERSTIRCRYKSISGMDYVSEHSGFSSSALLDTKFTEGGG